MKRLGFAALMAGLGTAVAAGVARADWTPMISSCHLRGSPRMRARLRGYRRGLPYRGAGRGPVRVLTR